MWFLILHILRVVSAVERPVPALPEFKEVLSLEALLPLRDSSGVVRLTDANLKLITQPLVREPHLVVLITANSPQVGCKPCKDFKSTFEKVAAHWAIQHPEGDGLYFVELDFAQNQEFFKELGINNVPHIWIVPSYDLLYNLITESEEESEQSLKNPQKFRLKTSSHFQYRISEATSPGEFARYISQALTIGFSMENASGFEINENHVALFIMFLSSVVLIKKKLSDPDNTVLEKLAKPRLWLGLLILLICLFCSGYMFTIVRGVPLFARNENGPFYFAGGSQYQIGIESFIVAGVYMFIGLWMVLLTDWLPKALNPGELEVVVDGKKDLVETKPLLDEDQESMLVIVSVLGLYYGYSLLTSIYLKKDPGYPFALPWVV